MRLQTQPFVLLAATWLAVAAVLSGCSFPGGFKLDRGDTEFAKDVPTGVSSAWRQGNSVWVVPSKNAMIQAVFTAQGEPLVVDATGAYVKVKAAPETMTLRINGTDVALRVPLQNSRQ